MGNLRNLRCEACRPDAPRASEEEIAGHLRSLPQWQLTEEDGVKKLTRTVRTSNFKETMRLVNSIADLAESEGHHPVLQVEYRRLTVWWWSHEIRGLHLNDFIMCAKTDDLVAGLLDLC